MTGHTSAVGWVAWLGQSSELSRSDPITAVANALRARDSSHRVFAPGEPRKNEGAPNPLRGLVLRHRNHGASERAAGLSQLIQNREVIGVGDRYQVAWNMPLRPVGMVIAAARDHGRQLAGAVGDTQRLVNDRPPHRRELLDFLLAQLHLVVDMRGVAQRTEIEDAGDRQPRRHLGMIKNE
jgi:hypothetical protein